MFSQRHPTDRRAGTFSEHHRTERGACNDNGRFTSIRRNAPVHPAGVVALAARKGTVVLSYVADGVMIISRDAAAAA